MKHLQFPSENKKKKNEITSTLIKIGLNVTGGVEQGLLLLFQIFAKNDNVNHMIMLFT